MIIKEEIFKRKSVINIHGAPHAVLTVKNNDNQRFEHKWPQFPSKNQSQQTFTGPK